MSDLHRIALVINGEPEEATVESGLLLVELLRDAFGLEAAHAGCTDLTCGACTVLLDGRPVKACAVLAVQADGLAVRTTEGLAEDDPVAVGFREEHGLHCGYCTPGMMIAATALLAERADPSEDEIRRAISGNSCRCTGYANIIRAVHRAARLGAGD